MAVVRIARCRVALSMWRLSEHWRSQKHPRPHNRCDQQQQQAKTTRQGTQDRTVLCGNCRGLRCDCALVIWGCVTHCGVTVRRHVDEDGCVCSLIIGIPLVSVQRLHVSHVTQIPHLCQRDRRVDRDNQSERSEHHRTVLPLQFGHESPKIAVGWFKTCMCINGWGWISRHNLFQYCISSAFTCTRS